MPTTKDALYYTGGRFALELDGVSVGWVQSARGGDVIADVVEEKPGPGHVIKKHIAGVKFSDIEIACGAGMSGSFFQWLADTVDLRFVRKSGAVVLFDYSGKVSSRLAFDNALISEIGFPALDGSSKDAAKLTVKFAPERARSQKGAGLVSAPGGGVKSNLQTRWSPSNFRLQIDGLDCTRVNRIEALVLKQAIVQTSIGDIRDYAMQPAHLDVPDLVITIPESHAADFVSWHDDFVVQGRSTDDREKGGTLEFLDPNMRDVLFTIGLQHLGIYKLSSLDSEAGEGIRRLQAFIYCEQMTFAAGRPAGASGGGGTGGGGSDGQEDGGTGGGGESTGGSTNGLTEGGPVLVDEQEPPLVVVSGARGPVLAEDIPDRFTRIRRTS